MRASGGLQSPWTCRPAVTSWHTGGTCLVRMCLLPARLPRVVAEALGTVKAQAPVCSAQSLPQRGQTGALQQEGHTYMAPPSPRGAGRRRARESQAWVSSKTLVRDVLASSLPRDGCRSRARPGLPPERRGERSLWCLINTVFTSAH